MSNVCRWCNVQCMWMDGCVWWRVSWIHGGLWQLNNLRRARRLRRMVWYHWYGTVVRKLRWIYIHYLSYYVTIHGQGEYTLSLPPTWEWSVVLFEQRDWRKGIGGDLNRSVKRRLGVVRWYLVGVWMWVLGRCVRFCCRSSIENRPWLRTCRHSFPTGLQVTLVVQNWVHWRQNGWCRCRGR